MPSPKYLLIILSFLPFWAGAQSTGWPANVLEHGPLEDIFKARRALFEDVVAHSDQHRLQIIYTQIDRDAEQRPHLKHYGFRLDTTEYFYPASMVKLPVAALALEKLNLLARPGLNKETPMFHKDGFPCYASPREKIRAGDVQSVGQYIRKIFLVSDNDAFNQLFDFVGRKHLNERLWDLGYPTVRIGQRISPCTAIENQYANEVSFVDETGKTIYHQEAGFHDDLLTNPYGRVYLGEAHENRAGKIVPQPFDFTASNFISLWDLHQILISIMMPESQDEESQMLLKEEDLRFLRTYMSMLPQECSSPAYNPEKYFECYVKYLLYGREKSGDIPENLQIFNKVGLSHGFVSDVAYVVDYENGVEFFLSAVIYVNGNQTVNDGTYEYEEIGFPFMKNLGKAIYEYESGREKKVKPQLKRYGE